MEEGEESRHEEDVRCARRILERIPTDQLFELPGRPHVCFQTRNYTTDKKAGRQLARNDVPFLFKAFESGQARPPRPGTKKADEPRAATIHEYLDWTVTSNDSEQDFAGFRVVTLLPRFRPAWPPPGAYDEPAPRQFKLLGAPLDPLPQLLINSKPVCAATIRGGPGYLEVPFFATQDTKRNRGFGRALLEAIEDIARCLGLPILLLCSTDDPITKSTWKSLGFVFTTDEDMKVRSLQYELENIKRAMKVGPKDLLHMDNTVQMHKTVPVKPQFRSIVIKHDHWRQRIYMPLPPGGEGAAAAAAVGTPPKVLVNGSSRKRLRVESSRIKVETHSQQKQSHGSR